MLMKEKNRATIENRFAESKGGDMFRVAICDDNANSLELENSLIVNCLSDLTDRYECTNYLSGQDILDLGQFISKYDLLILDVKMDPIDGITLAKKIRENGINVDIAFVTDYFDFATIGYEVQAIRYIVKNTNSFGEHLIECIQYAYSKKNETHKYIVDFAEGSFKTDIKDIILIQCDRHYLLYYIRQNSDSEPIMRRRRICVADAETELDDTFVRTHKSFFVNMRYLMSLLSDTAFIECNNFRTKVPVARNRLNDVKRKYSKFLGKMS